jgi:hypothetical protein
MFWPNLRHGEPPCPVTGVACDWTHDETTQTETCDDCGDTRESED